MLTPLIYAGAFLISCLGLLVTVEASKEFYNLYIQYIRNDINLTKLLVYKRIIDKWAISSVEVTNLRYEIETELKGYGYD